MELNGQNNEASPSAEKVLDAEAWRNLETSVSGDGEEVLLADIGEKAEEIISGGKIPAVTSSDSLTSVSLKAVPMSPLILDIMNAKPENSEIDREEPTEEELIGQNNNEASPSAGLDTMNEAWSKVKVLPAIEEFDGRYGVNKPPRSPVVSAVKREVQYSDKVKKQVKMHDGDGVDSKDDANTNRNCKIDGGIGSKSADAKIVGGGGLKQSHSVAAKLSSLDTLLKEPEPHEGGNSPNENGNGHASSVRMMKEAWERLHKAYVYYKEKPIGMVAALDPCADALNYNKVFIRDFIPCGLACLMKESKGEWDVVKNFLSETLRLQWNSDKKVDNYTLGKGAMPACFSVEPGQTDGKVVLSPDFGGTTIGRVAPSDSGFWWIILLRAYTQCTGSQHLSDLPDFQRGIKAILNLCLADGFDAFPTLLCADACCMIDRRMGMYGYPIEIQALFFFALRCAKQLLIAEDCKELISSIDKRIAALVFHIQTYYWLDFERLNKIYRYKTEEHSHTAVNKFNVNPDSIPSWIFDFMPLRGGYLIGNVGPSRKDFRWFAAGNCIAILCSLATPQHANAIMDLIEARWEYLIGEMPLKIAYPALVEHEWEIITGCDMKNTAWSNHNAGSWPVLLWLITAASIKTGRPHIAKKAIELTEQRLAKDGWPEYYDGKRGRFVGKQARKYQTWSIAGYLVAKLLMENPSSIRFVSFPEEEDRKIARPKLMRSQSCPCFTC